MELIIFLISLPAAVVLIALCRMGSKSEEGNKYVWPKEPDSPETAVSLSAYQKLQAMALKHHTKLDWIPRVGDFYTSESSDLKLYRITDVSDLWVHTEPCDPMSKSIDDCALGFPRNGFVVNHVHVPHFILHVAKEPRINKVAASNLAPTRKIERRIGPRQGANARRLEKAVL